MTDETDTAPIADGLDSWWKTSVAVAAANKEERDSADFQAERTARYLASGGTDDMGGFEYGFGAATNRGDF